MCQGKLVRFQIRQVLPLIISGPVDDKKCQQSELAEEKECIQSQGKYMLFSMQERSIQSIIFNSLG